ncbi:MAG: 1-acyl-sn-glycerol-3-phosphate acyltransferase [Bacteroidales bacterium]|jgi:1-acyl-sn-glycerol-3-phosphate acyltransferase|nr:1-acyl-sn-glycerol-3-phosphate acyltransferase [Bacteroidales bacterium]
MWKKFAKLILNIWRWKRSEFPNIRKAIIIMAPHTSIFDFVWGKLYFMSFGLKPIILIKKEIFFWPLSPILKVIGGVPVDRGKKTGITETAIEIFNTNENFLLVITPEGTRKKTKYWKKGFARIAKTTNVPVILGYIDYKKHEMGVLDVCRIKENEDILDFIENIKKHYLNFTESGLRKNKFTTGYE